MGRRSIQTTKSGKFMNPTDQARKEARKRELKKNKKQRKMVREAVLKSKDPQRILEEIEKIDALEIDAGPIPLPNDKALKDKKKKLKETLDRLINLYEKDDPSHSGTVRKLVADSERKRLQAQLFAYETRQRAQEEEDMIPDIPLPTNIPLPHAGMLMPSDIPLPGPLPGQLPLPPGLIPPGPPPGPPPSLPTGLLPPGPPPGLPPPNMPPPGFPPPGVPPPLPPGTSSNDLEEFDAADHDVDDDEDDDDSEGSTSESEGGKEEEYDPEVPLDRMEEDDDHQARESTNNKDQESRERPRTVRFADEVQQSEDGIQAAKNTSSIQDFLLKMAGQQQKADNQGDHTKRNLPQTGQEMSRQSQPPGPPPGPPPIRMPPPENPPPGVLPIQPNFQIRPPPRMFPPGPPPGRPPGPPPGMPGMVPPGPPPGLPPNMMAHAMVRGPRPLMQQSMPLPPPVRPGMVRPPGPPPGMLPPPHGAVLSAPPTFISKPPVANLAADGGKGATISKEATATISAKPQLRNTQAELTKLIPTALRVKREQPKNKAKPRSSGIGSETIDTVSHHVTQPRVAETGTKDDAYALFMKEMQGLL